MANLKSLIAVSLLAVIMGPLAVAQTALATTYETRVEYDGMRRPVKTIAPDNSYSTNTYNAIGQVTYVEKYTATNVLIQKTKTDYTITGRVWKTYGPECFTYPTGTLTTTNTGCNITITTYDALDRPDIVTDGEGRQTQTIYLADSKVSKIIKALGTAIQQDYATYTYTTNGQQASVKDANGNLTEYFYDGFDRLDKFQLPHPSNTGQSNPADYEQYTYDAAGNMTVKRKRDGKTITNSYDALNRVITKSPQGQPSVSYTYDKVGRQTDVDFVGGGHLIHHTYDTAGRLIATNDNGRTLSYQYTDKVNRTRIIWPDGYSADYAYDNLNRVTTIKENNAAILATYAYDTSGRRASITLGNGTITSYSYHNDDALNTLSHNVNGSADDVDWTYGFNKINQLTNKIMGGGANLSLYKWEPQYAKTDAYTSNGLNQYANVAGTNLSYDLNGNLTSDGVWNYVYDTENMLLNASKAGASASYIYDPLGRRSAKTVDTVLTTFLNDGVEEIADYNSSGALLRRYVHGPGVDEYLVMYTGTGTANKSYFHANHQGSIIAMSDSAGNVTEQHSYDSYGNSDDLTGNPFRYTGRRLDAETGLYYYRARYYSPAIGRFLQTDPIGYGDGLNWYAYVQNDPMNGNDPTGNCLSRHPGSGSISCFFSFDIEGGDNHPEAEENAGNKKQQNNNDNSNGENSDTNTLSDNVESVTPVENQVAPNADVIVIYNKAFKHIVKEHGPQNTGGKKSTFDSLSVTDKNTFSKNILEKAIENNEGLEVSFAGKVNFEADVGTVVGWTGTGQFGLSPNSQTSRVRVVIRQDKAIIKKYGPTAWRVVTIFPVR